MTDRTDYFRLYAKDVGVNPPIGGFDNVQDVLAGAGGGGGAVLAGQMSGLSVGFNADGVAPINVTARPPIPNPYGAVTLTVPSQTVVMAGSVVGAPILRHSAFAAAVTTDVTVSLFVTDATGANSARITSAQLTQYPAGPVVAATLVVDYAVDVPVIVGADLSVVGSAIVSAAGGVYSVMAVFTILPD